MKERNCCEVKVTDLIKRKMYVQQKRLLREINRCLAEMKNIFRCSNERRVINMQVAVTLFIFYLPPVLFAQLFIYLLRRWKSQANSRRCQSTFEQSQPVQDDQHLWIQIHHLKLWLTPARSGGLCGTWRVFCTALLGLANGRQRIIVFVAN